jgi:hypothetical protein
LLDPLFDVTLKSNVFSNFFEENVLCSKILADGGRAGQGMELCSILPVAIEPFDKHANIGSNSTTCLTSIDKTNIFGSL